MMHMATKRISTRLPSELLKEALSLSGLNQTQTLVAGLRVLIAERKRDHLLSLKGRMHISYDVARSRGRAMGRSRA